MAFQVKGRNMITEREISKIWSARKYIHCTNTIIGYSRVGQDKVQVAYLLWEWCIIPDVVYGVEAMTISKSTIAELNRIQNMIAKFILKLQNQHHRFQGILTEA